MTKKYQVSTKLTAEDRVTGVARNIARGIRGSIGGAASSLRATFGMVANRLTAIGGLAGGVGIGALVKSLVSATTEADTMQLAITNLVQAANRKNALGEFGAAGEEARRIIEAIRHEAITTPAELNQVADAFRSIYMRAKLAGAASEDVVKLAGNIASMEAMDPSGQRGIVARDVNQLMKGEVGDIDTPQLAAIAKQAAAHARGKRYGKALAMITAALDMDPRLREAIGESLPGQISTLSDMWREFRAEAGKPIAEEAGKIVREISTWIRENPAKVRAMAQDLGNAVVSVVRDLRSALSWIHENREAIGKWAEVIGTAFVTYRIVDAVTALVGGLRTMIGLGPALGTAMTTALGPIGLAVTALGALVYGLAKLSGMNEVDRRDNLHKGTDSIIAAGGDTFGLLRILRDSDAGRMDRADNALDKGMSLGAGVGRLNEAQLMARNAAVRNMGRVQGRGLGRGRRGVTSAHWMLGDSQMRAFESSPFERVDDFARTAPSGEIKVTFENVPEGTKINTKAQGGKIKTEQKRGRNLAGSKDGNH